MPSSSSPPKGIHSAEWLNGRFNTNQIGKRLVVEAVGIQMLDKAIQIAELISGPVNQAIDGFFQELVRYMGSELDLASQLPIPGLRPWNPLSLDYIKRKGSEQFFLYTLAPGTTASAGRKVAAQLRVKNIARSARAKKLMSLRGADTLISTLRGISGGAAFGGAVASVMDSRGVAIEGYGPPSLSAGTQVRRTYPNRTGAKIKEQVYYAHFKQAPPDVAGLRFRIEVHLWTSVRSRDFAHIEDYLQQRGLIDEQAAIKLRNRRPNYRPLIRPFMAYYSQIVIPKIIREVVGSRYQVFGEININGGRFVGAL